MFLIWRWPFKALLIGALSLICFGLCMALGYSFHLSFFMGLLCSLACFITVRSLGEIPLRGRRWLVRIGPRGSWTPRLLVAFLHFILLVGGVAGFFVPGPDIHPAFRGLGYCCFGFQHLAGAGAVSPGEGLMRTLLLLTLLCSVLASCSGPSFPAVSPSPPRTPVGVALPDLGPQPGICGRTPGGPGLHHQGDSRRGAPDVLRVD